MTIEKTYKLTIKDQTFFLSEEEVSNLYQQCRYALNIKDLPITNPVKPNIPYPYDTYPWYPHWDSPTTTPNYSTSMINTNWHTDTGNRVANKSFRSSVEQALDKLKNNKDNTTTNTSEGIKVG
jgi:hypothetical protein